MIQTTHTCRKCGSADIVKNGHSKNGHSASGSQQYHCKSCGAYLVLDPKQKGYSEEEKVRGRKRANYPGLPRTRLENERGSKSAISRIFGVSRNTLSRWLKKRDPKPTP